MASATGWNIPDGPARFGPRRPCSFATTRRSISVMYAKAVSSAKMTIALLMMPATMGLLRNSSMGHLLLLSPHSLRSQVFPGQSTIECIGGSDFQKHILGASVVPLLPQLICQAGQNFPVGHRAGQRPQGVYDFLHMVIDVGHAAIFFGESDGWHDDIGLLSRLGQENILYHQQFQVGGQLRDMAQGVGPHYVQHLQI